MKHRRFRKRGFRPPEDRARGAAARRRLSDAIQRRGHAEALGEIERQLGAPGMSVEDQARLVSLAGDSEYRRGAFGEAARLYLKAGTLVLQDGQAWNRPMVAHVRALLISGDVVGAVTMARHVCGVARQKRREYEEALGAASRQASREGRSRIPAAPAGEGALAARLGRMFLDAGEVVVAEEMLHIATRKETTGPARAWLDLARLALGRNRPDEALRLAGESLRRGNYGAETIAAWPILIAARRACGGWQIAESHLRALERVHPAVRARAILAIAQEMRTRDMRQWRTVALPWLRREGRDHPAAAAEIRKLELADLKTEAGSCTDRRVAAESLLSTDGLSPQEWLSAAKEVVRASYWEDRPVRTGALLRSAAQLHGEEFRVRAVHGLALASMMAKRHDAARALLQENVQNPGAAGRWWGRSVWALARMEAMLGRHDAAADLYGRLAEHATVPVRFRLQAGLLWAGELAASGQRARLLQARRSIEERLKGVQDPETLMDFARQLRFGPEDLKAWSDDLFARAEELALKKFRAARHPAVAMLVLYRLTRRQVYDFRQSARAVAMWDSLPAEDMDRLWSRQTAFWAYLGLVMEAHARTAAPDKVESFARAWLDDEATPAEGLAWVGIPYAKWLLSRGRVGEALAQFDASLAAAPAHPECAHAHYWKALAAWKRGDVAAARESAVRLRAAQGVAVGQLAQWNLDAKALLLLAGLEIDKVDRQAVNYAPERLKVLRQDILDDLAVLP